MGGIVEAAAAIAKYAEVLGHMEVIDHRCVYNHCNLLPDAKVGSPSDRQQVTNSLARRI
jgi:hypothetical protein